MIKKTFSVAIVGMLLTILGSVSIVAAEPTLPQVLNNTYGRGNWEEIAGDNFTFISGSYKVTVILVDKNAAFKDPTGWYDADKPANKVLLFDNPPKQEGKAKTFFTDKRFGLYIKSSQGTFYSEKSKNPDKLKHVRLFKIDKNKDGKRDDGYAMGFEDLFNGGDKDYQDIVIELTGADLYPIPEFPTIAIPVISALGIMFLVSRQKDRK